MPNLPSALDSLLENEALTADLDDDAADGLLEWGMAHVRQIHRMAGDEPDPEGYVATQMKATRQWMRAANRWIASRAEKDAAENAAALEEFLALAGIRRSPEQQMAFLTEHLSDPPVAFITQLRQFSESPDPEISAT